jgi:hypothetical protein
MTTPQRLPFVSLISRQHDPDGEPVPACVWPAGESPVCEGSWDGEACDFVAGVLYGTDAYSEPKFCPRHYYKMHYEPNPPYTLAPACKVTHEPGIDDAWHCQCGNETGSDGFDTCTPAGVVCEPVEGEWDGHYKCCDCGYVFHMDSVKPQPTNQRAGPPQL